MLLLADTQKEREDQNIEKDFEISQDLNLRLLNSGHRTYVNVNTYKKKFDSLLVLVCC